VPDTRSAANTVPTASTTIIYLSPLRRRIGDTASLVSASSVFNT
jgi:hypothetical protein